MTSIFLKSLEYAEAKHGDQKYGNLPYSFHLLEVHKMVVLLAPSWCVDDEDLVPASILHDILEDTDETFSSLSSNFGESVASLVFAVSNEEGKNRKERNQKTYPKIRSFGEKAVFLKLCDRLANASNSLKEDAPIFSMYAKEHDFFKKALYLESDRQEIQEAWKALDGLFKSSKFD